MDAVSIHRKVNSKELLDKVKIYQNTARMFITHGSELDQSIQSLQRAYEAALLVRDLAEATRLQLDMRWYMEQLEICRLRSKDMLEMADSMLSELDRRI